ncbi:MAG TPA: ABC-2 family transporter protein [Anaeromyxobacteraceae bacterium]|nr:ABC-2 family transporter protein [Anaeromyxobacteraceae bacterium]
MGRYLRLLGVQFRASAQVAMQYRVEFLVEGLMAFFWMAWAVVPVLVVYDHRSAVAGWTFEQSLVVVGFFILMKGILEGAVNPSLASVVEHIRKGTLDFVLLKPADAQFLVSTAKFEPWRVVDVIAGTAVLAYAFARMGRAPGGPEVACALALALCAVWTLYAVWILVVSAAFFVVKVDNLSFLFLSIFDAARWPVSVFTGFLRVLFTVVVPLALMTTFPAEALLGRLPLRTLAFALLGTVVFSACARGVWIRAIGRYTSASS